MQGIWNFLGGGKEPEIPLHQSPLASPIIPLYTKEYPVGDFRFVMTNAGNTCYVDSTLVAMFMCCHNFDDMLRPKYSSLAPEDSLRSFLCQSIIQPLRENKQVTADTVDLFLSFCRACGWELEASGLEAQSASGHRQQDVSEWFNFLIDQLHGPLIGLRRRTFTGAEPEQTDTGPEETIPFLSLGISPHPGLAPEQHFSLHQLVDHRGYPITVCPPCSDFEELLETYFFHNIAKIGRKVALKESLLMTDALNTYALTSIPRIVPIALNRFDNSGNKVACGVSFPNKIHFHRYISESVLGLLDPIQRDLITKTGWRLHAIVCHRGESIRSGHYYCYFRSDLAGERWHIFDDLETPQVRLTAAPFTDRVLSEGYLFFYKLDDSIGPLPDPHRAASVENLALSWLDGPSTSGGGSSAFPFESSIPTKNAVIGGHETKDVIGYAPDEGLGQASPTPDASENTLQPSTPDLPRCESALRARAQGVLPVVEVSQPSGPQSSPLPPQASFHSTPKMPSQKDSLEELIQSCSLESFIDVQNDSEVFADSTLAASTLVERGDTASSEIIDNYFPHNSPPALASTPLFSLNSALSVTVESRPAIHNAFVLDPTSPFKASCLLTLFEKKSLGVCLVANISPDLIGDWSIKISISCSGSMTKTQVAILDRECLSAMFAVKNSTNGMKLLLEAEVFRA